MIAALALAAAAAAANSNTGHWEALSPGLELGTFQGPPALHGDAKIRALRVDPKLYELRLVSAGAEGEGAPRTAKAWARRAGAVAAINPSMFKPDGKSVSLFRTKGHVGNPRLPNALVVVRRQR